VRALVLRRAHKGKRSGRRCSPHEEESGEFTSGGEATVRKLVDGGELRRKQGRGILVRAVRATKKKTWSRTNLMSNRHITREGKEGGRGPSPAMESSSGQQWLSDRKTTAKAQARVGAMLSLLGCGKRRVCKA
jgi:hypothetical protein